MPMMNLVKPGSVVLAAGIVLSIAGCSRSNKTEESGIDEQIAPSITTAPSPSPRLVSSGASIAACGRIFEGEYSVVLAYESTAGQIAAWEGTGDDKIRPRNLNSQLMEFPPAIPVTVCFVNGPFAKSPPPPPGDNTTPPPSYDRGIYFIPHGADPLLYGLDYRDRMTPEEFAPPAASESVSE